MTLYNPYTGTDIEYNINLDLIRRTFDIEHETDFCSFLMPWHVVLLMSGDMVYIPRGRNRSRNIYVVTKYYRIKAVEHPHGIYTIPMSYFATAKS